ncbi:MAG: class B sortase, partial [Clostridia bacterium]|nr:class B sortase [Clostridia bacterium]
TSGESYNAVLEQMRSKINYYKKINDDVKGYIYIPGTQISYLYVQGEDNDYYLTNTYEGEFMPAGSIFADYRCLDPLLRNFNFILYGHNMQNGLMFNGITEFLDEQFFKDHSYVYIYTLDGIFTYEIFSIRKVSMYDDYIRTAFYNSQEFMDFAYRMQEESLYLRNGGLDFNEYDRILTLSTCTTNFHTTERYTLQAKLINVES